METLIQDALKDFEKFKELTETIPLEVLSAEAEALSKSQQQIFQEYCDRIHKEKQLKIGDIVNYLNPDKIPRCVQFEGIDLEIIRLIPAGYLAFCRLPDGTEQTFGTWTLRRTSGVGN